MVSARTAISVYFLFSLLLLGAVVARPGGPFVVVITNPAESAGANMAVIAKAGGRFVWSGRYSWISVAQSDEPGFVERLFQAGAFMVLNHELAVGCLKE